MATKTHRTAVVLIPPEECWAPIQAIRQRHDRHVRRWMPHLTLLYPFRSRERFDEVVPKLREACLPIEPFEVRLTEFNHFDHGQGRFTLWLVPEPPEAIKRLQAALESAAPECHDVSRYSMGFTPHLSIGQARGHHAMLALLARLRDSWRPLSFMASHVSLIWRGAAPDNVFRVDRSVQLGPLT
jgi:2'-5' RNA ligase